MEFCYHYLRNKSLDNRNSLAASSSLPWELYAADVVMHHKNAMLYHLTKCSTPPFPSAGSQEDFPNHMIN